MHTKKDKIREFIDSHFFKLTGEKIDILDSDNIFKLGIVNSMFAMQLVKFLEKEFNVCFSGEELNVNNFCCIQNMVSLLEKKLVTN